LSHSTSPCCPFCLRHPSVSLHNLLIPQSPLRSKSNVTSIWNAFLDFTP
jgi:hypothetical protein